MLNMMDRKQATDDELMERLAEVSSEMRDIKLQIEMHEMEPEKNKDWLYSARRAYGFKAKEHHGIQAELGQRKRDRKKNTVTGHHFMQAARRILPDEVFKQIKLEAESHLHSGTE